MTRVDRGFLEFTSQVSIQTARSTFSQLISSCSLRHSPPHLNILDQVPLILAGRLTAYQQQRAANFKVDCKCTERVDNLFSCLNVGCSTEIQVRLMTGDG